MQKTLLLCFIHGFKGGDDTFGTFPEHLRALISHALPNITVVAVTYPKFETRGDLHNCVARFREWIQNVVIDLEVSAGTPSPTVDPSVRVILCGHSMGGIVAAETLFSITSDNPLPLSGASIDPSSEGLSPTATTNAARPASPPPSFMFPFIQGILAFDTPYLGISPGVVAHGAESHYKTAASAYSAVTELASVFGYGAANSTDKNAHSKQKPRALPAGPEAAKEAMATSMTASTADAAATPVWQRWGKYAMFAGAAGAVAAGGAAAYIKRNTITEGWTWVGSHLEFVGCLMRGQELQERLEKLRKMRKEKGVGFKDLITVLGKGASGAVGEIGAAPTERTFCVVPRKGKEFEKCVNEKAKDEIGAHQSMFWPRENPGFFALVERCKTLVVGWVDEGWYGSSDAGGVGLLEDVELKREEVEIKEGSENEGLGGSVIVG